MGLGRGCRRKCASSSRRSDPAFVRFDQPDGRGSAPFTSCHAEKIPPVAEKWRQSCLHLPHRLALTHFRIVDNAHRRILATLLVSVFATVLGVGVVVPLLPIYAHGEGAGGFHIALIFGAYAISRTLLLPLFGHLSDRKGRKTFLTLGLLAYAVISIALAYIDGIAALVVIRVLHGAASAMLIPIFQAYAAELAPAGREGRIMGVYGTVVLIGIGLGPFVGGLIYDHWGFRAAFCCMGALALLAFAACAWLLPPASRERTLRRVERPNAWRELLGDRAVASLFTFRFAYVVCVGIIWAFVPLYASLKLSLSGASIGLIITLGIMSGGVLNTPMGILADRTHKKALVVAGGFLAAYGVLAFQWAESHTAFVWASVCFGAGGGVCMPALMALAAQRGKRSDAMASVMALMTVAHGLGMLAGALVGGVMMDVFELRWVFTVGASAMVLGTAGFVCGTLPVAAPKAEPAPVPIDAVLARQ
jgi:MFS transporter, DHA1 family, multidrug resistance protein